MFKHALSRPMPGDDNGRPWPTLPDDPEPKKWVVIVDGNGKPKGGGR
ncbi:hypothetical protein [Frankia sp. BMG5.23]|nr:hypothetical protein [Frankia sp. BMG5.23]